MKEVFVMAMQEQTPSGWRLGKEIPVGLMFTVILRFISFVWWAASVNELVTALERYASQSSAMVERVTRVETLVVSIESGWRISKGN
ncbi:hypothetical protein [Pseudovibrio sp. Ad37]|uniref:hypothetical protein n=1 Tax=Pseudovibrio sp. Ad37 TaxID=989422 RepID=UPI0007AE65C3|nr:hypothetical protein [Pseudovibrio sp. Ad37]